MWAIPLLLVLIMVSSSFSVFANSGDVNAPNQISEPVTRAVAKWTYMVYLNGDNSLSTYTDGDLTEMETGYNDAALSDVNLICLWDKSTSGDTKVIKVYNGGYDDISSSAPWWTSEMDMGNPQTLIDFVEWTVANYPAEHYFLDLWDHGGDYDGAMWDDTSSTNLDLPALRTASRTIYKDLGFAMDIWGYDACEMNAGADNYQIKLAADIIVASEHTEGGDGWDYNALIGNLTNNPSQTPEQYAYSHVVHVDDEGSRTGIVTMAAINTTKWDYYWIPAYNALAQKLKHKAGTEGTNIQTAFTNAATADSSYWANGKDVGDIAVQLKSGVTDPEILYWADRLLENSTTSLGTGARTCIINAYDTDTGGTKLTTAETTSTTEINSAFYIFIENQWDEMLNQVYSAGTDVINLEPTVTIDSPSDGAKIPKADGSLTISGTAADSDGTVSLVQVKFDRDDWIDVTGTTSWAHVWDLTNVSLGWHHIMARSYDGTDFSELWPAIDVEVIPNSPPDVNLIYPVGGEILSGNVNIQWNATDADGDPITIDLYYSDDGGSTWNVISTGEANDGSYLWNVSSLADGVDYIVRVNATDTVPQTSTADSAPVSIDNIPDDQWFLQIQTPGVPGYQNLSMEPVELTENTVSSNITAAGQFLIGSTGWMTHSFTDAKGLNGNWSFNIWGRVTDGTAAAGHLYAKIYRYDGFSLTPLYTTIEDDEDVSLYTTTHLFTWTDAVAGSINPGDSIAVEIWLNASNGATSSFISDYAISETSTYGTQTGDYTNAQSSDDIYEQITESSGAATTTLLSENFEAGALPTGWSHAAWDYTNAPPDTVDEWAVGTPSGTGAPVPHSGSYCAAVAMTGDYSTDEGAHLESPQITIPSGATGANLSFWLFSDMENTYDGLNLKMSVNGGAYQNVTTSVAYDDTALDTTYSNPIGGEAAWCGVASWRNPVFDILSVASPGDTVQFRWHFGSDSSITYWGPAIDDVVVTADFPTSTLEHTWTFSVTGGGTGVTFAVEAYHTANTEGDDFNFSYSTDGITYIDMLTVTKTSDDNVEQTSSLPSTLTGTVYVKVVDTDRTAGNTVSDTLYVDKMVIRTLMGAPQFILSYDYGATQSNIQPSIGPYAATTFDIPVHLGWNLMSYPLLASGDIETVLNDDVVWDNAQWYNPLNTGDHWKTHVIDRTLNDLNTIDNMMAVWLHVTNVGDGFLTVSGDAPTSTVITLNAGWNLVSYPASSSTAMNAAGLPLAVTKIGQYDGTATYLVSEVADWTTSSFLPGNGYWLYSTADTTWTVTY